MSLPGELAARLPQHFHRLHKGLANCVSQGGLTGACRRATVTMAQAFDPSPIRSLLMPQAKSSRQPAGNRPEKKIGPYPGGIGVAIWTNAIQTDGGQKNVRSITLSPRRYKDAQSGQWKDSASTRSAISLP